MIELISVSLAMKYRKRFIYKTSQILFHIDNRSINVFIYALFFTEIFSSKQNRLGPITEKKIENERKTELLKMYNIFIISGSQVRFHFQFIQNNNNNKPITLSIILSDSNITVIHCH